MNGHDDELGEEMREPECAVVNKAQAEALCRLLVDSGDMTPMAAMQLRKLWGGR